MRQREILCIDDDEQSLVVRKLLLETRDFRVTTATSAKAGLLYFRTHHVDAVVLDYEMPEMNGGQVAQKMKSLRAQVPVLILSALPWLPPEAPKDCIDVFVTKGGPTAELVQQIEQMIDAAPVTRGRSMRLVGAVSGVVVAKVRGLLAKPKPAASPKPLMPAGIQ
ncbi:MAG: response regulator [Terriglobales bacterium]